MSDWKQNFALDAYRQGAQPACIEGTGVCLRELPSSGKLLLQARGNVELIRGIVNPVLGLDIPAMPNTSVTGRATVLCLGPRKWLMILESASRRNLQWKLESALSSMPHLISDWSDARVGIEVRGAGARTVLARVCALDLGSPSFRPGQCAQSLLARAPLILHQVDESPVYHLYLDRSLAAYAWEWLADAVNEFVAAATAT